MIMNNNFLQKICKQVVSHEEKIFVNIIHSTLNIANMRSRCEIVFMRDALSRNQGKTMHKP